jgi:CheY-like chemotaxis protein
MDISMPVMDGYTATKKIREYEEERKANPNKNEGRYKVSYIIGVSGHSDVWH